MHVHVDYYDFGGKDQESVALKRNNGYPNLGGFIIIFPQNY